MLRRVKKKKQKKALLEAQKAANILESGYHTLPTVSSRPLSTASVPVLMEECDNEHSGSDIETESLSYVTVTCTGEYMNGQPKQEYCAIPQVPHSPVVSIPPQPIAVQHPMPPASVYIPNTTSIMRRGSSQPNIPVPSLISFAPTIPPVITTNKEYSPTLKEPQTTITSQAPTSIPPRINYRKIQFPKIDPAKAELIKTSVAFGLGRGIDATNKSPWMNKSSFQVRRVHNSIVETNEGNAIGSYQHEILSTSDMEDLYAASLNIPETPVTIHVECDCNRSIYSSRQVIGKKVITRTIGFQADTEEKYTDGESPRNGKESHAIPKDPSEIIYNTQNSSLTFEDRVCLWLLHKIAHKCYLIGQRFEIKHDDSPTNQLMKLIQSSKSVIQVDDEIKAGCKEIVQALRVTHYVTSIKLGAAEYRIMSDGEYQKQVAKGGAFGLDIIAEAATTGFANMKQTKKEANKMAMKTSNVRKIGTIKEDNTVEKGSPEEVVLTVQVQPITRLIRLPAVKMALRDALEIYMEGTPTSEGILYILSLYL